MKHGSQRLYRDPRHGIICGVCAGVADYFGLSVGVVRLLALLGLLFFMPGTILIYFVLCCVLRRQPEEDYMEGPQAEFRRSVRRSPGQTFDDIRQKFRELENRLRRLEGYVTSSRFNLDQEFRDLENR